MVVMYKITIMDIYNYISLPYVKSCLVDLTYLSLVLSKIFETKITVEILFNPMP